MNVNSRQRASVVGLVLAGLTLLCYSPSLSNKFINVDDAQYIVKNPNVAAGLTWSGVRWAFQSGYACNWHPLTWLSHMADCSLYGLDPVGHHLTSVLLHVANTLLLFGLVKRMTGAFWRSAMLAAFFAWHPVHVESVAWAAERKDVLSTFFFLLTLLAYVRYVELSPNAAQHATRWRSLSLLLFALGLMCKPMLVTLPFVLLLLDYWPLRRVVFDRSSIKPLVREKIPFFALSIASSAITYIVQQHGGAVSALSVVPLGLRVSNALVTYVRYIAKTIWPANLSPVYPLPEDLPLFAVVAAGLLLALGCAVVLLQSRRRPYLFTSWFWYLGTLVPTIGLVQVGPQAMADRYLYIPSIGLFLVVIWGLTDLISLAGLKTFVITPPQPAGSTAVTNTPLQRGGPTLGLSLKSISGFSPFNSFNLLLALTTSSLIGCLLCTYLQTQSWHDGETLYRHSLQATGPNYIACDYLGVALQESGKTEEALAFLAQSVRLAPRYGEGQYNLGTMLLQKGRLDEAVDHLKAAVQVSPTDGNAHHNLGNAYLKRNQLLEATAELAHAAALKPDDAPVRLTLGSVLLDQGRLEEAAVLLSDALHLAPNNAEARRNLGVALVRQGKAKEARRQFAEAVWLDPKNPALRFNLGLALLEQGRPEEAATQFSEGLRRNPNDANTHCRLGIALSQDHKSEAAVVHFREALRLQPDFPEARRGLALALALEETKPTLSIH